jgi:hypothetical protein
MIEQQPGIDLIEQPEYKRRWSDIGWDQRLSGALREWLLDRCEAPDLWSSEENDSPCPLSTSTLADRLTADREFVFSAAIYAPDRDLAHVLHEILADEHVPYLTAMRFKDTGLRKRATWEDVWRLQQKEDEARRESGAASADRIRDTIPTPLKYSSADFLRPSYWRNRGKYDMPNERFVSYPGAADDGSLLIGWAGWSHVERARALVHLIERMPAKADIERTVPLLAGLQELLLWIRQWHDELAPARNQSPAEVFEEFLRDKLAAYDLSPEDLKAWRPPRPKRGRPRKNP